MQQSPGHGGHGGMHVSYSTSSPVAVVTRSDVGYHQHQPHFHQHQQPAAAPQPQQHVAAAQPGGYPFHGGHASSGAGPAHGFVGGKRGGRGGGRGAHRPWEVKQYGETGAQYDSNPVGALQERFQSRGIVPDYRMVQAEGASHCPTFAFQVFVTDYVAMGSGSSKKQAKHNAARAMLDKLDGRVPAQDGLAPLPAVSNITTPSGSGLEADSAADPNGSSNGGSESGRHNVSAAAATGNTIGLLQEHCVHHGLPMPIYDLSAVDGQPHQRSFAIKVRVGNVVESGEGTSKKDAKRDAADRMIKTLRNCDPKDVIVKEEAAAAPQSLTKEDKELLKKVEGLSIDTITPKHSKEITKFYKKLQDDTHNKLYVLHRTSLKGRQGEYVQFLKELAAEQKFEVTFVELEEGADDGSAQCIVQLSTLPVAVCCGNGADKAKAEEDAAKNALNYLKIMTKKAVQTTNTSPAAAATANGK